MGESEETHRLFIRKAYEALKESNDDPKRSLEELISVLHQAKKTFNDINVNRSSIKPRIGLVGEIYIRFNQFSNEFVVSKLEELGAEVWLPTFSEWFLYLNFTGQRFNRRNRHYRDYIRTFLTDIVQKRDMQKLEQVFEGDLVNLHEPSIKETMQKASSYLNDSFEGEAVLSMGKCADFLSKGVSGLVNVMPFTCMPGTIVSAVMKRYQEDHNNIPFINMAFDGQEETNTLTRLEAFMHQVKQYQQEFRNIRSSMTSSDYSSSK
jgi:predicted nucleotide-binding protein (sugar kinase/HSP70/actin superfamily)